MSEKGCIEAINTTEASYDIILQWPEYVSRRFPRVLLNVIGGFVRSFWGKRFNWGWRWSSRWVRYDLRRSRRLWELDACSEWQP